MIVPTHVNSPSGISIDRAYDREQHTHKEVDHASCDIYSSSPASSSSAGDAA